MSNRTAEDIRSQCLELALSHSSMGEASDIVTARAKAFYEYVTGAGAPKPYEGLGTVDRDNPYRAILRDYLGGHIDEPSARKAFEESVEVDRVNAKFTELTGRIQP